MLFIFNYFSFPLAGSWIQSSVVFELLVRHRLLLRSERATCGTRSKWK